MSLFVIVVTSDLDKILLFASFFARGVCYVNSSSQSGIFLVLLLLLLLFFLFFLNHLRALSALGTIKRSRFLSPSLWFFNSRVFYRAVLALSGGRVS